MDWLRVVVGILVVVVLALLMGKTQKSKSTAVHVSVWVGSILVLLALRFGFTRTWDLSLLLFALTLHGLDRIPFWFVCVAMLAGASYFIALRLANSTDELARKLERTNERMTLLENSIRDKLDDIASQLPEKEE